MKDVFYVYKHTSPSNKVYIGITSQRPTRRWSNGRGYKHNEYFFRAILKYGWDNFKHEIICEGLNKEQAEQMEIELIRAYKSNDKRFGYNIQSGGNYAGKHSEETKRKFSEMYKGRKPTQEALQNMSNAHVVKKIVQYDKDENLIAIWNGCKTAGKALHIPYQNISDCVKHRNGRTHAGGYIWRYAEDVHS